MNGARYKMITQGTSDYEIGTKIIINACHSDIKMYYLLKNIYIIFKKNFIILVIF